MSNTEMLARLRKLHEELSSINDDLKSVDQVEEETIDALGQLVTDVNGLVDGTNRDAGSAVGEADDTVERHEVLDRVMRFESAHPRVSNFLAQVTDLLAMMGI